MKRALIAAALAVVVAGGLVWAEGAENPPLPAYEEFTQGLGFSGGELSGFGISYRNWVRPNLGIQVCAGALYLPAGLGWGFGNLLEYWVSLEGMRTLYATEFTSWLFGQLYVFAGVQHSGFIPWIDIYEERAEGEFVYDVYVGSIEGAFTPQIGAGIGFGVEVGLFRHLSGTFELGYAAFWQGTSGSFVDQLSVDLVPQGSFHFRY